MAFNCGLSTNVVICCQNSKSLVGLEAAGHSLDAAAFVVQAGVDIKVHGGGDGGVSQDGRHGLVVASALNAAGGKAVSQGVEAQGRNVQRQEELVVVVPVVAGLQWLWGIAEHVILRAHELRQRPDPGQKLPRQGNVPQAGRRLWGADGDGVLLDGAVGKIDTLDGPPDAEDAGAGVQILPLKAAYLANSETALEADEYAQVPEREVLLEIIYEFSLLMSGEDGRNAFLPAHAGEVDLAVVLRPCAQPGAMSPDHLQNQQAVLDRLDAVALGKHPVDPGLDRCFFRRRTTPKPRQDMPL